MVRMILAVAVATSLLACKADPAPSPLAAAATAGTRDAELSHPHPILHVRSLAASQTYYRDVLGFKVDWDHGDPPSFGAVSRGDASIFLCQGCVGPPGAWMMIFARDVDKLYDELRSRHALIRLPPTNMPWQLREMHVADLDGNVIRFGSSIPE